MKEVVMTISEFLNFRKEAAKANQMYGCSILTVRTYSVEADLQFLTKLGF